MSSTASDDNTPPLPGRGPIDSLGEGIPDSLRDLPASSNPAPAAGFDLSQDVGVSEKVREQTSIATEEWKHRQGQELTVSSCAISLAALLFIAAVCFGIVTIFKVSESSPGKPVDWHVLFVPLAFVIPPTVIIVALIRSIYARSKHDSSSDNLPALSLVKEIAVALKEVFGKAGK